MAKKVNNQTADEESWGQFFLKLVAMMVIISGATLLIFSYFLSNNRVSGASMQPNFENNERLISQRHFTPQRNQVVVLRAPKAAQDVPGTFYVKRIIGLPGDKIVSKNDKMYVNGKLLPEPYLENNFKKIDNDAGTTYTTNFTYHVPKGTYWVMGDHRDISKDSRFFGSIKRSALIGKVTVRYWPLNRIQHF
ncbi:signal peptidase I [Lactobacillus sp. ESL0785]|uniref:signal peptidase I n=1 Tax=Lactobacillus sp. ESL0785 TaxID=2983232 RepID=UPI0023F662C9|nr:signal peptidase I [Lactobacillus sp. ESL0785]WEV70806.1 signal peptidase I [Lactobacillus sp. ESL0785]